ncbi:DNA polymerase III subunit chi [Pseudomonas sp. KNUC1026]|uniref:DNA polymerase III subunit chi n=1 Tax=Pseudomonas sp. KNUC1026 TaxID=2893890 RepID=UPI001F361481|nr:DNA polymerase III subunit chi [Pseudomonas sp. KNUC1026]UFH48758.1 DNA polymerase III subunit chi [Pseudomonas sp. KNUC1026]
MSKPPALPESHQLLDDLESIRALLGDDTLEPPLLTDTVHAEPEPPSPLSEESIPLLSDPVSVPVPVPVPVPVSVPVSAPSAVSSPAATPEQNRQATLLHLDAELRDAARKIMQDVIDDFAPHIETEIRRRLEARMAHVLKGQ